MISKSLQFTVELLDRFLKSRFSLSENNVVLNSLLSAGGAVPAMNQNKVVITFINIEKSDVKAPISLGYRSTTSNPSDAATISNCNLYILVSANFDSYAEALKFLDASVSFFKANSITDAASVADMPVGLARLEFTMENTSYDQVQHMWLAMGATYQPSAVYKVSVVGPQA